MTYEEALKTAARTVAGLTLSERETLRQHPDAVLTLAAKLAEPIVAPTVAKGPVKLIDRDGDVWDANPGGTYTLAGQDSVAYRNQDRADVERRFGPVTEVTE